MKYLPRIADKELSNRLRYMGAVLIEGPKWCGKTTTAAQQAGSILKLQDPDMRESYLATARSKPSNLLKGETPRLIDEWQDAPVLWDAVRTMVDNRGGEPGQFMLTGSNSVDLSKIMHSGTGRISRMRMYPMSLYESGESTGAISLQELFDNLTTLDIDGVASNMDINNLIYAACRGGWPAALRFGNSREACKIAKEYLEGVVEADIMNVDGVKRDPDLARAIIRTYSRNLSTLAKRSNLVKDVNALREGCSDRTFDDYIKVLTRLFIIQDLPAWSPAVRSATVIRRSPKRGLVDPSIAVASLGLSPQTLEVDLKTFGFIFECMAIRDLKAYTQANGGTVSFYHDRYDLEADAVLHLDDGRYALIEFKLGSAEIEMGASHLLKIRDLVRDYNAKEQQLRLREPDLLLVITGGPMAYTRPDGVKVIPLACLKD
jgi:predicted AAA+ superfamily ATPase